MTKTGITTGISNLVPYTIDWSLPAMKVWRSLPESLHAEVIDNKLYVSSPPSMYHVVADGKLKFQLWKHIKRHRLGELYDAPVGVFLTRRSNVVEPDIIFVSHKNKKVTTDRQGIHGPPDLCIEILSPGTKKYDRTTKKRAYERSGVKEYWLVDPETKETTGFLLKKGAYDAPLVMKSKIFIRILNKTLKF